MTDYAPVLTSAPAGDPAGAPVTLNEVKQHLRMGISTDDDGILAIYLGAAVAHLDGYYGWLRRAMVTQSWRLDLDVLTQCIRIPLAPVSSITSITYEDVDDVTQTISAADYATFDLIDDPHIRFIDTYLFPNTRDQKPVASVTFVAGYGAASAVPAPIKAAILLMVGDMYESREAKLESGLAENSTVRRLLDPFRRGWAA